jgi:hypothetical protein
LSHIFISRLVLLKNHVTFKEEENHLDGLVGSSDKKLKAINRIETEESGSPSRHTHLGPSFFVSFIFFFWLGKKKNIYTQILREVVLCRIT